MSEHRAYCHMDEEAYTGIEESNTSRRTTYVPTARSRVSSIECYSCMLAGC
jgi:hypothetical protein